MCENLESQNLTKNRGDLTVHLVGVDLVVDVVAMVVAMVIVVVVANAGFLQGRCFTSGRMQ